MSITHSLSTSLIGTDSWGATDVMPMSASVTAHGRRQRTVTETGKRVTDSPLEPPAAGSPDAQLRLTEPFPPGSLS